MPFSSRRDFMRCSARAVGAGVALSLFPPSIRRAFAIPAHQRTGTIQDVEHIVVLMQENRSFDHYFGTMRGVRGFGDRFAPPNLSGKTIWSQTGAEPSLVLPFHLNTVKNFRYMRAHGTPHEWSDAQAAWDHGRMSEWPVHKRNHSMAYYTEADLPFQFAMANAFTLCDAYHCSFIGGTLPNRMYLWTGTNGPPPLGNGPALNNSHESLLSPNYATSYLWKTYPERLREAGIRWQVYQNFYDNYTDNPLVAFKRYRDAYRHPTMDPALFHHGVGHRDLDQLKRDVLSDNLPQVSWIVGTAAGSEHPGPSSPAQGAEYTARVLDALTSNPRVWSKTVFIVNFDENDGYFDHIPPPAVPSYEHYSPVPGRAVLAGDSTVNTELEYHHQQRPDVGDDGRHLHSPYGLGPRVPMYILSPWTKGGWVCSQVFDHTSVLQFIEKRFGVIETNISPWRRAICGDLSSAFNFAAPNDDEFFADMPDTRHLADRARAVRRKKLPAVNGVSAVPVQARGVRLSRALPYELHTHAVVDPITLEVRLTFINTGSAGVVFHVYDRRHLDRIPRRYTVEAGKQLAGEWQVCGDDAGLYDLWVLGPNGYHRAFVGNANAVRDPAAHPEVAVVYDPKSNHIIAELFNHGRERCQCVIVANAYMANRRWNIMVDPGQTQRRSFSLQESGSWYDFTMTVPSLPGFLRRFAGRMETGQASVSDPAMGSGESF